MGRAESNGMTLEYETLGDAAGPPLLLIMGLGAQMTAWPVEFLRQLAARGHHVIRFDNRDIGLSTHLDHLGEADGLAAFGAASAGEAVEAPYSLADMAADAVGLLDALGHDTAHIVGASMGGMIAQRLVIDDPQRARSLTSIFSMPRFLPGEEKVSAALMAGDPGTLEGRIEAGVEGARLMAGGGFPFDEYLVRDLVAASIARSWHPEGQVRQMVAMLADGDRTEALRSVDLPTLVVHGTMDPLVVPQGGQETADAIPGAGLLWIDGMGHELPPGAWPVILDGISDLVALVERSGVPPPTA